MFDGTCTGGRPLGPHKRVYVHPPVRVNEGSRLDVTLGDPRHDEDVGLSVLLPDKPHAHLQVSVFNEDTIEDTSGDDHAFFRARLSAEHHIIWPPPCPALDLGRPEASTPINVAVSIAQTMAGDSILMLTHKAAAIGDSIWYRLHPSVNASLGTTRMLHALGTFIREALHLATSSATMQHVPPVILAPSLYMAPSVYDALEAIASTMPSTTFIVCRRANTRGVGTGVHSPADTDALHPGLYLWSLLAQKGADVVDADSALQGITDAYTIDGDTRGDEFVLSEDACAAFTRVVSGSEADVCSRVLCASGVSVDPEDAQSLARLWAALGTAGNDDDGLEYTASARVARLAVLQATEIRMAHRRTQAFLGLRIAGAVVPTEYTSSLGLGGSDTTLAVCMALDAPMRSEVGMLDTVQAALALRAPYFQLPPSWPTMTVLPILPCVSIVSLTSPGTVSDEQVLAELLRVDGRRTYTAVVHVAVAGADDATCACLNDLVDALADTANGGSVLTASRQLHKAVQVAWTVALARQCVHSLQAMLCARKGTGALWTAEHRGRPEWTTLAQCAAQVAEWCAHGVLCAPLATPAAAIAALQLTNTSYATGDALPQVLLRDTWKTLGTLQAWVDGAHQAALMLMRASTADRAVAVVVATDAVARAVCAISLAAFQASASPFESDELLPAMIDHTEAAIGPAGVLCWGWQTHASGFKTDTKPSIAAVVALATAKAAHVGDGTATVAAVSAFAKRLLADDVSRRWYDAAVVQAASKLDLRTTVYAPPRGLVHSDPYRVHAMPPLYSGVLPTKTGLTMQEYIQESAAQHACEQHSAAQTEWAELARLREQHRCDIDRGARVYATQLIELHTKLAASRHAAVMWSDRRVETVARILRTVDDQTLTTPWSGVRYDTRALFATARHAAPATSTGPSGGVDECKRPTGVYSQQSTPYWHAMHKTREVLRASGAPNCLCLSPSDRLLQPMWQSASVLVTQRICADGQSQWASSNPHMAAVCISSESEARIPAGYQDQPRLVDVKHASPAVSVSPSCTPAPTSGRDAQLHIILQEPGSRRLHDWHWQRHTVRMWGLDDCACNWHTRIPDGDAATQYRTQLVLQTGRQMHETGVIIGVGHPAACVGQTTDIRYELHIRVGTEDKTEGAEGDKRRTAQPGVLFIVKEDGTFISGATVTASGTTSVPIELRTRPLSVKEAVYIMFQCVDNDGMVQKLLDQSTNDIKQSLKCALDTCPANSIVDAASLPHMATAASTLGWVVAIAV